MRQLYAGEAAAPLPRLSLKMEELRGSGAASAELDAQYAAVAGVVWTPSMQRMFTLLDRSAITQSSLWLQNLLHN